MCKFTEGILQLIPKQVNKTDHDKNNSSSLDVYLLAPCIQPELVSNG